MKAKQYKSKPKIIEAIQFDGLNTYSCMQFIGKSFVALQSINTNEERLIIATLEGDHICSKGDFIIKGIHGEFYPCKPDIFEKSYEELK